MYVDESGDSGSNTTLTKYFALSGLVVHETAWQHNLGQLIAFRRAIKTAYGLKLREEIHAGPMINRPGSLVRIKRNDRLMILRHQIDAVEAMRNTMVINVLVDKQGKDPNYDVFQNAWRALIQRLENTVAYNNFPGPRHGHDFAMILPDDTNRKKLTQLVRQMRHYNPVPNTGVAAGTTGGYRNLQLTTVCEDPFFKDSQHSFFLQAADTVAYMLHQRHNPNAYIRKQTGHGYFHRLNHVLCRVASRNDPHGIVRL